MTGGLRETASLMAIAALICVGATVFGAKPAKAADLGGDCCADLEERVADLEATTVRKGNKKVSVQIYGKVNYAAMWWDDGGEQNVYVVNNYNESTRTGIKGKAKIAGDWEGGYRLEWEYRPAASPFLNQFNDNNADRYVSRPRGSLVADVPRQQALRHAELGPHRHAQIRHHQKCDGVHLDGEGRGRRPFRYVWSPIFA